MNIISTYILTTDKINTKMKPLRERLAIAETRTQSITFPSASIVRSLYVTNTIYFCDHEPQDNRRGDIFMVLPSPPARARRRPFFAGELRLGKGRSAPGRVGSNFVRSYCTSSGQLSAVFLFLK